MTRDRVIDALGGFGSLFRRFVDPVVPRLSSGGRRMVANSSAVFVLGAVTRAMSFLAFILLSRALHPAQLGTFALVLATVEVTRHVTDLGFGTATVRRLSGAPDGEWPRTLGTGFGIRMLAAVVGFLGLLLLSTYPSLEAHRPLFVIGGLSLFTAAGIAALTAPFQASLQMAKLFQVHLGSAVLYLGLVAWGAVQGWPLAAFLVALVLQDLVTLGGISLLFLRRFRMARPRMTEALPLARDGLSIGLLSLIVLLYFRLDVFMLEALKGSEAVGQYALAFRISEAVLLGAVALSTSAFPRLVELSADPSRARLRRQFRTLYMAAGFLGVGAAIAVSLVAPPLVEAFLPNYGEAARLVAVLIWSVAFMFVNVQTADLLIALGYTGAVTRIACFNLALNAAFNLVLIPRYGAMGAVMATVATEGLNALMQGWYLTSRIGIPVPTAVWALGLVLTGGAVIWNPSLGAAGAAVVLALLVAYRMLGRRADNVFT